MKNFATRTPIIFEILLFIVAIVSAGVVTAVFASMGMSASDSSAMARIVIAAILFAAFIRSFSLGKSFRGLVLISPLLIVVVWNVALCSITGGSPNGFSTAILLSAIAPAIFEEVIFRGIFIDNLKASGKSDMATLFISAIVFALVHMTNAVGMSLLDVAVQVLFALAIGLVLGAVYIRTQDIISVIIMHALIDLSSYMFPSGAHTTMNMVYVFIAILVVLICYGFGVVAKHRN